MDRRVPKIMLKVTLCEKNKAELTLLLLSERYLSSDRAFIFTRNGWTIYRSSTFNVTKRGVLSFPRDGERQSIDLYFNTDKERYSFLKDLYQTLKEWAKDSIFKDDEFPIEHVETQFFKSVWVVY